MADFAAQRRRNEAQRQVRLKSKKTSSTSTQPVKSYVDPFGVIRREGGTGFKIEDYNLATSQGRISQTSGLATIKGQPKVGAVEKPIFTVGTALRLRGITPEQQSKVKFVTNKRGQVIGVEDPFSKSSYQLSRPVEKKRIEQIFTEKQLEKESSEKRRKLFTTLETAEQKRFEEERLSAIQQQAGLDKLDKRYKAISKRLQASEDARNTFKRYSGKVTDSLLFLAQGQPKLKLIPKRANNYIKEFFREISAVPYDFTVGAGRGIAGLVDQVAFQIQAQGIGGYTSTFFKELLLGGAAKSVIASFDPRTPEGLANIVITLAVAKSIQNQKVKIRELKSLEKVKNWKPGEVIRRVDGTYAIKTKAGRIFKVKPSEINAVLKANRQGAKIRFGKTEVARITKKQLKGAITKSEGKILTKAQAKKLDLKITREANKIGKKFGLNAKELKEFRSVYSKFRKTPNLANARKLNKFRDRVSVDQIVRSINKKIASRLKTTPKAPKIKKIKAKKPVTPRETIKKLKAKAKKIFTKEKSKADISARKRGFKDAKEQLAYDNAFTEYKTGNLRAGRVLEKIEKSMRSRKAKASKLASKRYEALRQDVIIEAKQYLREGKIAIKDKRYARVKAPKKPMSKARAESLAIQITQKYNKISDSKYNKQAREVLKRIIKGETIEIQNPQLLSAIKRLINRQKLALISKEKRLRIQAGLVKGKTPKVRLSKAKKRTIKGGVSKEIRRQRIVRKKSKRRTFLGEKAERKIRRKQILNELKREEAILKKLLDGDKNLAKKYSISFDSRGNLKLIPKTKVIKKGARIKTATEITKKANLKKGDVKVGTDGTIQVLKTKKVVSTKTKISPLERISLKKAELQRVLKKVTASKRTKTIQRPRTVQLTKRLKRVSTKTRLKKLPKLKVVKFYSTASVIVLEAKLMRRTKAIVKQATAILQKPITVIKPATISAIKTKIATDIKIISDVISDIDVIIKTDVSTKQKQILKEEQKLLTEQIIKLKKISKKITSKEPPKKPIKKVEIPDWDDKLPKGKVRLVNVLIRSRGKIKELKLRTTPNRAYRYAKKLTDNTLSRSFQLKIVGVGKGKDIKTQSFAKFRVKKSKGSRVLNLVERSKYSIDTKGEKSGLTVAKALKKKAYRKPKRRK